MLFPGAYGIPHALIADVISSHAQSGLSGMRCQNHDWGSCHMLRRFVL